MIACVDSVRLSSIDSMRSGRSVQGWFCRNQSTTRPTTTWCSPPCTYGPRHRAEPYEVPRPRHTLRLGCSSVRQLQIRERCARAPPAIPTPSICCVPACSPRPGVHPRGCVLSPHHDQPRAPQTDSVTTRVAPASVASGPTMPTAAQHTLTASPPRIAR